MHAIRHAVDWFIRDKDGRISIFQLPNFPLAGWFGFMVIAATVQTGTLHTGANRLSLLFLAIWAYLEITSGSSPFRRVLGIIIAGVIIFNAFS